MSDTNNDPVHGNIGTATHVGLVRDHNEDALSASSGSGLFVVADGVGGHQAGEVASRIAVEKITSEVESGCTLKKAIRRADETIKAAAREAPPGRRMGTTVVTLQLSGRQFRIAWVGDSRAYRVNKGINQLSRDHSVVQELLDRNIIDQDEALTHPKRNVITRALGGSGSSDIEADEVVGEIALNDIFVLCSDGLHGLVSDKLIEQVVSNSDTAQAAADELVELALGPAFWSVFVIPAHSPCC